MNPLPAFLDKRLIICSFSLLFLSAAVAMAEGISNFKGLKGTIAISGGTAHYPVMNEFKRRIEQYNPEILISVRGGGSSTGIRQVGQNLVDIGNAGRPLSNSEQQQFQLKSVTLALDAIVVVVHPDNPVTHLSTKQVRKIFSGEISHWSDLGGVDKPISVYDRKDSSGTKTMFIKKLLQLPASTKRLALNNHDEMKVAIAWDKNAIGYMSAAYLDASKGKAVILDGMRASQKNITAGRYPLSRKLFMYIPADNGKVSELTQTFIDYASSPETATIIEQFGYIPLK